MNEPSPELAAAIAEIDAVSAARQNVELRLEAASRPDTLESVLWLLENGFVTRAKRMVRRLIAAARSPEKTNNG